MVYPIGYIQETLGEGTTYVESLVGFLSYHQSHRGFDSAAKFVPHDSMNHLWETFTICEMENHHVFDG